MTDHPSALVSVPDRKDIFRPIIGIENRTPQEVFDMMCDRIRFAASPAAPQAVGVGELVGQIDALLAIPDENLSARVPYLARELLERAASHLRAPSREPEGGVVDGPWAWLTAYVEDDGDPADCEYNCDDMVAAWRAGYAALATREEAPADHHERNLTMTNDELIEQALSHPPMEAPAEAGERDYPAEFEAWWSSYRHRNRDVADYPVKKQIAFDAFYFGARAQPQAREDAQPVAVCDGVEQPAFEEWASKQGLDMHEHPLHYLFLDAKTDAARQAWKAGLEHAVGRMATHPAPDAQPVGWLRAADEEMVCAHLGVAEAEDSYETAKQKLASLIQWNIAVAMDPSVGGEAQPVGEIVLSNKFGSGVSWLDGKLPPLGSKLYTHPNLDTLRIAEEALTEARSELEAYEQERTGETYNNPKLNQALAALQAEQKGGA